MEQTENNPQSRTIKFDNAEFEYLKNNQEWTVALIKSAANLKNEQQLAVLKVPEPYFLPCTYEVTEDKLLFHYAIERPGYTAQDIQALDNTDKLKAVVNLLSIERFSSFPYTFFLHPENIYYDYNLIPSIAYRGIKEQMPPTEMNDVFLLRNLKSYIISLFQTQYNFTDLYEGNLENITGNEFIMHIKNAETFNQLAEYLKLIYHQKTQEDKLKYQKVDKKKYTWSRQLSIWFGAALVIALAALIYFVFIRSPFQNRLLQADAYFVQNNYSEVVSTLNPVDHTDLPVTQKYILAYSVVQGQNFNEEQKKVILNNVSLKSDTNYLDFWVHIGRGDFEEAIDVAKKIGDYDLILYGLVQIREQIVNNPDLTGEEREEQLSQYENQYDEYTKERDSILDESTE
ncbi:type VII secretion protein EssB [Desemzia sp. FAM 23991]|uniref:type VII secretion protein EssB n=1 Tax=unclassified Desemzia TaxID=2685243 RepID=UPI0038871B77